MSEPFETFRQPLLADPVKLEKLRFPVMVSPKLDGIRCIMQNGVALSRKMKPIPNRYIQEQLAHVPDGFDGELLVGPITAKGVMQATASGVMSRDGTPDFVYMVFDRFNDTWPAEPFHQRYTTIQAMCAGMQDLRVDALVHWSVEDLEGLMRAEEAVVTDGFEGLMIRSPDGPYKQGRSTANEQYLLKMKRFFDAEAIVVGVEELTTNTNEKERDERGYAKRSKKKEGLVGAGTLGKLICSTRVRGDGQVGLDGAGPIVQFELGGGFTAAQRHSLWARRDADLVGTRHTFKYQELTPDNKPRFPVWKAERPEIDG